jgi:hypothetical protein
MGCGGVPAGASRVDLLWSEQQQPTPDFKEVYDLIKAHLGDVTDADLNRAAVQGFIRFCAARCP